MTDELTNILVANNKREQLFKDEVYNHLVNYFNEKNLSRELGFCKEVLLFKNLQKDELCAHAHLISQKYVEEDSLCSIEIPKVIIKQKRDILFADEDGSDSKNLIKCNFFDDIYDDVFEKLYREYRLISKTHIFQLVKEKFARDSARFYNTKKRIKIKSGKNSEVGRSPAYKKKRKNNEIKKISEWNKEEINYLLEVNGFQKYVQNFKYHHINGDVLKGLTLEEIENELEINNLKISKQDAQIIYSIVQRMKACF